MAQRLTLNILNKLMVRSSSSAQHFKLPISSRIPDEDGHKENYRRYFWVGTGALGTAVLLAFHYKNNVLEAETRVEPGVTKPGLPYFSAEEVSKHDTESKRLWVFYKDGVYDVTDLMKKHPGSKNIMMAAAGRSIEPFWEVLDKRPKVLLEKFQVGNLDNGGSKSQEPGVRKSNLPTFKAEEVSKHDTESKRVWVSYKDGVYDITDFIHEHPGAKNIMMGAGASIEPFWEIYPVHKSQETYQLLEKFRIGNLEVSDVHRSTESSGPFANEPIRHPSLNVKTATPFNAETPLALIADSFYTPNDLFYVRNHLPTPDVAATEYELEISGVPNEMILGLDDLKKFPKVEVTATIHCGGNRRAEMKAKKELKGLGWTGGAVGNAKWAGARLFDVLEAAGLNLENSKKMRHIQFEGYDVGPDGAPYGASIPTEKGFNPFGDVILAYEMNGEELPRDHGFPVRVVVPGVVGARHVKWVNRITVSENESESHWQQSDYKGFGPGTDWGNLDYSKSPAIQNMPVNSLITEPEEGSKIEVDNDGTFKIKGYAWSGSGNRIIRIDLTADGGKTWFEGTIDEQDSSVEPRHYGWTLWSARVKVPKGLKEIEVWSKAVDSSYNVQPESFENIWNVRGLLSNAYSRLKVKV